MVQKRIRRAAIGVGVTVAVLGGLAFVFSRTNAGEQVLSALRGFGQTVGKGITEPFTGLLEGVRAGGAELAGQAGAAGADVQETFTGNRNAISDFFANLFPSTPPAGAEQAPAASPGGNTNAPTQQGGVSTISLPQAIIKVQQQAIQTGQSAKSATSDLFREIAKNAPRSPTSVRPIENKRVTTVGLGFGPTGSVEQVRQQVQVSEVRVKFKRNSGQIISVSPQTALQLQQRGQGTIIGQPSTVRTG